MLAQAKQDMIADMKSREIGAILWDNATAGFPHLPEVLVHPADKPEENVTLSVMGLYHYADVLYLIAEGESGVDFNRYWDRDTEAAPTVVTLSETVADEEFGDPAGKKGFVTGGTLEEWLAIANCYFQALNQE